MSIRVKLFAGAIAAAVISTGLVGVAPNASAAPIICDNTKATPLTGNHPNWHVVVEPGDSCYIEDAVIHSLRAVRPENVVLVGTSLQHGVRHNIMIRGATGNVLIGNYGCKYDPKVGNNIMVRNSHNVLICQMSVDNNIIVRGNDGRITVRRSVACNNIRVVDNLPYTGPDGNHSPETIRLLRLKAANHIVAANNSGRPVVKRHIEENFKSPSECRKDLK